MLPKYHGFRNVREVSCSESDVAIWGSPMKKSLFGSLAVLTFAAAGPATAADLPVKAAPMAPAYVAPGPSWTGCWVSGGVGYGMWNQKHFDKTDPGSVSLTQEINTGGEGWLGRVGVGCDYQIAPSFVIGAFGDYDFMNLKGTFLVPVNGLIGEEKQTSS